MDESFRDRTAFIRGAKDIAKEVKKHAAKKVSKGMDRVQDEYTKRSYSRFQEEDDDDDDYAPQDGFYRGGEGAAEEEGASSDATEGHDEEDEIYEGEYQGIPRQDSLKGGERLGGEGTPGAFDDSEGQRRKDKEELAQQYELILQECGHGRFQWSLYFVLGLALMADGVEVFVVGFVLPSAEKDMCLSDSNKGMLGLVEICALCVADGFQDCTSPALPVQDCADPNANGSAALSASDASIASKLQAMSTQLFQTKRCFRLAPTFSNILLKPSSELHATKGGPDCKPCVHGTADKHGVAEQEPSDSDLSCLLASLVQLLADPHARTLRGFQSLVQREWVAAGHPFPQRLGLRGDSPREEPPALCPLPEMANAIARARETATWPGDSGSHVDGTAEDEEDEEEGSPPTLLFESPQDWERELQRLGAVGWRVSAVNERFDMAPR
ncbi:UNVERIFIED_CONTAM: hypothetical protein H355_015414 [Colinus virginianus]|nr:hypothetical protein H355_015414 [Colinus virginianus]